LQRGIRLELPVDRPFLLGRAEENDVIVNDRFVSSFHCRIELKAQRWMLIDLKSSNGTQVDGRRVRDAELTDGARIQLGDVSIKFMVDAAPLRSDPATGLSVPDEVEFAGMVACSSEMMRIFDRVKQLAGAAMPVLVLGETGVGKELVARALHEQSDRKGPFVALNCGALAPSLIESELFGHEKGAFTGADEARPGAFREAEGGTLFLDEIGELPMALQPKLLRAVEAMIVRPLGGRRDVPFRTRIVAATNRKLSELVKQGVFREDLLYRLFGQRISIPPLRKRVEDVVPIARAFIGHIAVGRSLRISAEAERTLCAHAWPGNVRELRNVSERAYLACSGDTIKPADIEFGLDDSDDEELEPAGRVIRAQTTEDNRIAAAMIQTSNNASEAARVLGLSKSTFFDKLRRLRIPTGRPKRP
jgi:DNA-binding NtrC family response regulator